MNKQERAAHIVAFIENNYAPTMRGKRIKMDLWDSTLGLTNGGDGHRIFGYTEPNYLPHDESWGFFFCPEVMTEALEGLSDYDFIEWLRYMRAHLNTHAVASTENDIDELVFSVMPEARPIIVKVFENIFAF